MFNDQLKKQLDVLVSSGKLNVRPSQDHREWQKRFEQACRETRGNVVEALQKLDN